MEFKTISEYPMYEISKNGIIRNRETKKIKSQYVGSTGYYMCTLTKDKKHKPKRVHRLLAELFIPNPNNELFINHIDGNKLNNSISNLEWCSHSYNMKHAFRTGLINNTGEKNGMSKLNEEKVKEIKILLSNKVSQYKIAELFNISRSAVLKINLKQTWAHV